MTFEVLAASFGLDTDAYSFNYLRHYGRDPKIIKSIMPDIARTARTLISAIEGERPDGEGEWL